MGTISSRRVIALADSTRINDFLAQPQAAGFTIFPAIDGRFDASTVEPYFDFQTARHRWGYEMPPSHAACAASHYLVIAEFAAQSGSSRDFLLVAEDDARFTPRFARVVERVVNSNTPVELVVLADGFGEGERASFVGPSVASASLSWLASAFWVSGRMFRFGIYRGAVQGTGLYLVSRSAARKYVSFVEESGKLFWPADWFHYWAVGAKIETLLLRPGIATWEGESTLGHAASLDLYEQRTAGQKESLRGRVTFFGRLGVRVVRRSLRATFNDVSARLGRRRV